MQPRNSPANLLIRPPNRLIHKRLVLQIFKLGMPKSTSVLPIHWIPARKLPIDYPRDVPVPADEDVGEMQISVREGDCVRRIGCQHPIQMGGH